MTPRSRLELIDALRGFAALAVLAVHTPHWPSGPLLSHPFGLLGFIIDFGRQGVPLFIVISGYCIHNATRNSWGPSSRVDVLWGTFFRRRLRRLYVPYLGAIVLGLLALAVASGVDTAGKCLPHDLPLHLIMMQNIVGWTAKGVGNGPLWTIGLEMQLYLLYPFVFLGSRRLGWRSTLMSVFAVTVVWAVFVSEIPSITMGDWTLRFVHAEMWPFEYWFIWCLGAYTCERTSAGLRLPTLLGVVVLSVFLFFGVMTDHRTLFVLQNSSAVAGIARPWFDFVNLVGSRVVHSFSILSFGVGFSSMIVLGQQWEKSGRRFFRPLLLPISAVGLISYSLYLTHIPVVVVWRNLVPIALDNSSIWPWILRYVIDFPICLAVAVIYFFAVERHFLRQTKSV